ELHTAHRLPNIPDLHFLYLSKENEAKERTLLRMNFFTGGEKPVSELCHHACGVMSTIQSFFNLFSEKESTCLMIVFRNNKRLYTNKNRPENLIV
ncbi:MAG: hypothetical protein KJN76_06250, partial [Eudoraea sp.]|nr:hypothetical protein [Eudoraea sp.]